MREIGREGCNDVLIKVAIKNKTTNSDKDVEDVEKRNICTFLMQIKICTTTVEFYMGAP